MPEPEPTASLKVVDRDYWLDQDARYIIEDPERSAYKMLKSDEERDNFIEYFWQRRDPTPDTIENEFKDEHYRRIVYANQRFSGRVPGWKTDRGRFYIRYGPPDSIEFMTLGVLRQKEDEDRKKYSDFLSTLKEDEAEDLTKYSMMPAEVWHYANQKGIGHDVAFGFADECGCNDPHLRTISPLFLPSQPLQDLLPPLSPGKGFGTTKSQTGSIEVFAGGVKSPQTRFKDLEEVVTSKVRYNLLPFHAVTNAVRATEGTDLVALTLQFRKRDLAWKEKAGTSSVDLHVFARFTNLTGRIAATVEDEIKDSADPRQTQSSADDTLQFSRLIPLRATRYRLGVVVEDANADKIGTWSRRVIVPGFYADEFKTSPLILADQIDTPARRDYPFEGELYIGDVRIHPRLAAWPEMPAIFHRGEQLGLFFQAYNLSPKPQTRESDAVIAYKMVNIATGKTALDAQDIGNSGEQLTVRRMFSTAGIPQGEYAVCVTVNDRVAHKSSSSSTRVRIE
jgi:GWxTD domain-containing protein